MPILDLAMIGEYTTDHGPFVDDWFLVFISRGLTCCHQPSMYAEGNEQFCKALGEHLGTDVVHGLVASADFRSRLIWPEKLRDKPLLTFEAVQDQSFLERLKLRILPRRVRTVRRVHNLAAADVMRQKT